VATDEAVKLARTANEAKLRAPAAHAEQFPAPRQVWIDFVCDGHEQWDAYKHLAPVAGRRLIQIGGKGAHAVKFLVAGAGEAWNISPMLGEARYAMALAKASGVEQKLRCVVGIGEELPFADAYFDGIFIGSCVHHMKTDRAFPEFKRVLVPGGRFAAVEPWLAPGYKLGIKLIGKREANPYCKPLTKSSASPLFDTFADGKIIHHGTFTRYALIAFEKTGLPLNAGLAWWIMKVDDAISSLIPGVRNLGSGAVLTGTR
jgi:SAM-dependent methyltransferase